MVSKRKNIPPALHSAEKQTWAPVASLLTAQALFFRSAKRFRAYLCGAALSGNPGQEPAFGAVYLKTQDQQSDRFRWTLGVRRRHAPCKKNAWATPPPQRYKGTIKAPRSKSPGFSRYASYRAGFVCPLRIPPASRPSAPQGAPRKSCRAAASSPRSSLRSARAALLHYVSLSIRPGHAPGIDEIDAAPGRIAILGGGRGRERKTKKNFNANLPRRFGGVWGGPPSLFWFFF